VAARIDRYGLPITNVVSALAIHAVDTDMLVALLSKVALDGFVSAICVSDEDGMAVGN
jgi:hypothetical protein